MVLNMFKYLLFNQSSINFPDSWNSGLADSVFSYAFGNTDVPVDVPQLRPINSFGPSVPALPASLTNNDRNRQLGKIFCILLISKVSRTRVFS